ncbi:MULTISPECIES: ABC transporter permease [Catenuloplanes]|uniref:ABC transport system permease protein n=1 Tax=Catenuloplanes niger TaxID=587534 RepID=A0AAE3ZUK4_9ACTN|nr:ABC transporter permease [Catenuloplanes niger]MDR7326359.1 putative ABC transport system permease protein [Catenuloplanes niger]
MSPAPGRPGTAPEPVGSDPGPQSPRRGVPSASSRPGPRRLSAARPAPHWPSVAGRARADAGPLALVAVVVVVTALLAGAVPPLLRATADAAVRDAIRRAGPPATVRVQVGWSPDDLNGGRTRLPELPAEVESARLLATAGLTDDVRSLLDPPIATALSEVFTMPEGTAPRTLQLAYLANSPEAGGGPEVTWVAGAAPAATREGRLEIRVDEPWPVQAGLSESAAAVLGIAPGARLTVRDATGLDRDVLVSGVFRPVDPADPAWRLAPSVLAPVPGADGAGTVRIGALLSPDSLPDARIALKAGQLTQTIWLTPRTDTITWASAEKLAAAVIKLKTTSATSGQYGETIRWETQLDTVLRDARGAVDAAGTQASVLLIAVLMTAALVLLLAADLLARRRAPGLVTARRRGAALPDLTLELLVEAGLLALLAGAAGLALALLVAPGVAVGWALPVVLVAALAGPAFGTVTAARATRNRRAPANRSARRWAERTGRIRRATLDAAIVLAATGAFVSLRQRGIVAGDDGLPAGAPALAAVAAGLLLLRLMPLGTGLALRRALRSRRPLAVFGAARAAATSGRALPLLAMVAGTALATFALTLDATTARGLSDGAWRTAGADARLDVSPSAAGSTVDVTARIAAAPGVRQAVAGQTLDGVRVVADGQAVTVRLVAVDPAAFRRLLADTPIAGAGALDRLAAAPPSPAAPVPVLVRSADGVLGVGVRVDLLREAQSALPLTAVGTAPAVGDVPDLVVADAAALTAAGLTVAPNTVWVTGTGAADAVRDAGLTGTTVLRAEVLDARRAAPLTAGLLLLARAAAVTLLAFALLGLFLGAAADAPERWRTLSRLRTLGLRPRDTRWVAAGELLPPALTAAIAGPPLGLGLAWLTRDALALRLLTGQAADPVLTPPWWQIALVAAILLAAAALVAPVEAAVRRHRNLAETLRIGG